MQVQQIIDQMIALSKKKYEELIILKNLSLMQEKAFSEQQLDDVEKILNKKDMIIQYIQKLDDAFLRAYDTLKEELGIESLDMLSEIHFDGGKELKGIIGEITEIIESIIQLEKASIGSASKIQKSIGDKIKEINAGKRMTTAYNTKPVKAPSYFIDKKN